MGILVLTDIENTLRKRERQLPVELREEDLYSWKRARRVINEDGLWRIESEIMLDKANKKRNTATCFEVGYVSSSLPIDAEFSDSASPRFNNHSRTLSRVP
jgi:hypothetical protein